MPLLTSTDPLPSAPQRVLVTGTSGSGKSTVARAVSAVLGLPYTELDSLFHGPGWVPRKSFVADVAALADGPRWVLEWQHRQVRPLLLARSELMVWLDLPRAVTFAQLTRRTVHRSLRRVELWNGNREPPLWTIFTDRDHILRWTWRAHPRTAARVHDVLAGPDGARLPVVRLRSRAQVRRWLAGPLRAAAGR